MIRLWTSYSREERNILRYSLEEDSSVILYEESDVESSSDAELPEPLQPRRSTENRLIATPSTLSNQHAKNSECHKEMREE